MTLIHALHRRWQRSRDVRNLRHRRKVASRAVASYARPLSMHLGCGNNHFPGWVHLDMNPDLSHVDALWHATDGLPCEDGACQWIYSEHFLEHLSPADGLTLLRDCRRALRPGGVLRIAMPDLRESVRQYWEGDWKAQPWLKQYGFDWIQTGAEMLNIAFREWGHLWLYDREELHRRLKEAGFEHVVDRALGESEHDELRNRETRPESTLICEAQI